MELLKSVIYFRPTLWNKKDLCGDNANLSVLKVAKATKPFGGHL